jgi:hypothetical protein
MLADVLTKCMCALLFIPFHDALVSALPIAAAAPPAAASAVDTAAPAPSPPA